MNQHAWASGSFTAQNALRTASRNAWTTPMNYLHWECKPGTLWPVASSSVWSHQSQSDWGQKYHALHDDVTKWRHFPRYWPFVRGIHRSPMTSPHKAQWRGALMFSLICVWLNGSVNNRKAGDLRRYRAIMTSLWCEGPFNNTPALVLIIVLRRSGDKPLSQSKMAQLTDASMRHSVSKN